MTKNTIHRVLTPAIALVWLINGLFCKLLNLVPRHHQIVARIFGEDHSSALTKTFGALEVLMFFWIISRIRPRECALLQIVLIAAMNLTELIMVPDLLLFGRFNAAVAAIFIAIIFINEFILRERKPSTTNNINALN
jgi:hypothetical protein